MTRPAASQSRAGRALAIVATALVLGTAFAAGALVVANATAAEAEDAEAE